MSNVEMRAKMRVSSVQKHGDGESVSFSAVGRNEAYPDDGSDENNTFAKFTPSADARLYIANPDLLGKFSPGDTFYVDFKPAPS